MKRKTRIVRAGVLFVLALTAIAAVVYAYIQSKIEQPNPFQIGEGVAEITEAFPEPTLLQVNQNSFEKTVTVQNTGTSDQFVRVFLDFSDSRLRDKSKILYGSDQKKRWSEFLDDHIPKSDSELPDGWAYVPQSDSDGAVLGGFFYYTEILAPGEETPPLILGIETDYGSNPDQIKEFDVIVYSESVQTVEIASGTVYAAEEWRKAWRSFLERSP